MSGLQLMQQLTCRTRVHLESLIVDTDVNESLNGGSG